MSIPQLPMRWRPGVSFRPSSRIVHPQPTQCLVNLFLCVQVCDQKEFGSLFVNFECTQITN
jgi:hypothetical protein